MIDTSSLQTLVAINKTRSFSKAAEELHVTQSAISQSIKNFEKKIGVKLISRNGKSVSLTHEGLKMCYLAKDFFRRYELVMSQIMEEQQKVMGRLSVGTLTGIGKSWVASKSVEFATIFPEIDLSVVMDFPENLIKKFENNELDVLIVPEYHIPAMAERLELEAEFSTLVYPDSPQFQIDKNTDFRTISSFPLIFFEENDPLFHRWCREKFGATARHLKPRIVVNSFGHMLNAVHNGLGIAVIPTHVFARSYFKDKVKTLGEEFQIMNDRFYFVYHQEAFELLKVKTFYEYIKGESLRLQEQDERDRVH
ncbi:MAG: LysR family transcriptional regulator [Bacteriovoracaceae bacterium]|nr:LysR family transcriptional regulator [Bacteriovoracaceae bacterium]